MKKENSTVAAGVAQDTIFFGIKCFHKLLFIDRTSVVLVDELEKFSDLCVFKSHIHLFQPRVVASRMLLRTSQTQHLNMYLKISKAATKGSVRNIQECSLALFCSVFAMNMFPFNFIPRSSPFIPSSFPSCEDRSGNIWNSGKSTSSD